MEEMRDIRPSVLLEIYGKLLTQKQSDALEMHLNLDYSLSEIAENQGVSRQAALDSIKRGIARLNELEEALGLYEKFMSSMDALNRLEQAVDSGADKEELKQALAEARGVWEEL